MLADAETAGAPERFPRSVTRFSHSNLTASGSKRADIGGSLGQARRGIPYGGFFHGSTSVLRESARVATAISQMAAFAGAAAASKPAAHSHVQPAAGGLARPGQS